MIRSIDQIGNEIQLPKRPQRIISLVPSQTEYLHWLGLDKEVIGITKFCIHPEDWYRTKTRIGGTKKLHLDKIKSLDPDLIIANKEENEKAQVEELAQNFPVWTSDIQNIENAKSMISSIAHLMDEENLGNKLNKQITEIQSDLIKQKFKTKNVLYLIWENPMMTIGHDTFIHNMLSLAGFENIYRNATRYPEVILEDIENEKIDLILLSSEPFPFKEKHVEKYQSLFPKAKILTVDGELFSWYGSRMLQIKDYFIGLRKEIDELDFLT